MLFPIFLQTAAATLPMETNSVSTSLFSTTTLQNNSLGWIDYSPCPKCLLGLLLSAFLTNFPGKMAAATGRSNKLKRQHHCKEDYDERKILAISQ